MSVYLVRTLRIAITAAVVAAMALLGWRAWNLYMLSPWTRDGKVRAYVVVVAPEISGRIVKLQVMDNQLVHKGDVLFEIDPDDYHIALAQAKANAEKARQDAIYRKAVAVRRTQLSDLAVSLEQKQQFTAEATEADASVLGARAALDKAQLDLSRTVIRSPVNGWVTNLTQQAGNYAVAGKQVLSLVDRDSFWVDGYFEETQMTRIADGARAEVKLMAAPDRPVLGHVESVAHAITDPNAAPDGQGLASVNPIFTWVRLAQRIPVRIHIDQVPGGLRLVAGMTCTVVIGYNSGL
jgi:multidrug resistance efflux pump